MAEATNALARTAAQAGPTGSAGPATSREDILALWIGLLVFVLAMASAAGIDLIGWAVTTAVWVDPAKALAPVSKSYAFLGGAGALVATYLALLLALTLGAVSLGIEPRRFAIRFTVVLAIAYLSWFAGSYAHFAVTTPGDLQKFGIGWSLKLTNEGGYIFALLAGLVIANALPRFAGWLHEAIRPELYIKIAIVILGGFIAVTAAEKFSLASSLLLRGIAAIVEAYLIYWAVVYYVARKWFGFSREWAAPLASGISICGVSAAIATGSAIRARPAVPILVSSLVVIFAVVEVLILPFAAQAFLSHEPLVAGAWLGLSVKTDGAAVASGAIADALIVASAAAEGINYQKGWILGTTATVKVFIDVFIGLWAFLLAYIWTNYINVESADKARAREIWERFPKFIIGYLLTFVVVLLLTWGASPEGVARIKSAAGQANAFRVIFFVLTFFSIGVLSNFRKLWQEGIGKLVAVYALSLFGFIIWVGLLISWLFFAGVKPPLATT
jgi:uncharacterized membrane protein YadS